MLQLTQKLKTGDMKVLDVPVPEMLPGYVLVRNYYSLISAGTEGSTVKTARKGYIGKAKERPQQVRQVIETLKSQGPVQTYRAVMKKLDAFSPLGYSCAGRVLDSRGDTGGLQAGDLVACGGLSACHAEVVSVPSRLCVRLDPQTDLSQAVYNTLGAIAIQGVRQADLRLGETCAVIGLGLVGQITSLLLKASGVRTIGIDIDPRMVELAGEHCVDLAFTRGAAGVAARIDAFTHGIGCDAVIITAAADSLDPINFAGEIARKKGTVVVVGMVPTGFDREPHYYRKELQVRMSCSYGPGRYDPLYEEHGIDYPAPYVRWTQQRNMAAFQELIRMGTIDVRYLTSHTYDLGDAPGAYDMMMAGGEPFVGILIRYDIDKQIDTTIRVEINRRAPVDATGGATVGFIGAGSYAQNHLLPNIRGLKGVALKGVMTATGTGARSVAERFGFEFCARDITDIVGNQEINTVFVATRHDSHAAYVIEALRAGKHVFVEKPLCLDDSELDQIKQQLVSNEKENRPLLMVGYNRRFSPLARKIKSEFGDGPMAMVYRVNAGVIPRDSWIHDPVRGGGRVIGEVCHFVDFLTFLNGSLPVAVYATAMKSPADLADTVNLSLNYQNGSIGTISYYANGDKRLPKEHVEIFANGCTAVIDDFKQLTLYKNGKIFKEKLLSQDKGQQSEIKAFFDAVVDGKQPPIEAEDILSASQATFKAMVSIRSGKTVDI